MTWLRMRQKLCYKIALFSFLSLQKAQTYRWAGQILFCSAFGTQYFKRIIRHKENLLTKPDQDFTIIFCEAIYFILLFSLNSQMAQSCSEQWCVLQLWVKTIRGDNRPSLNSNDRKQMSKLKMSVTLRETIKSSVGHLRRRCFDAAEWREVISPSATAGGTRRRKCRSLIYIQ